MEGRELIIQTLQSRHRLHPAPSAPGAFPYIAQITSSPSSSSSPPTTPATSTQDSISTLGSTKPIRHLAFARPPASGEFTDFTARYGALQEEDRLTFRETLSALHPPPSESEIERVARTMRITHLLDLPSVSFSSGQTRRGRIAAALLTRPVLLILEDPMAGLDVQSRKDVSEVLGKMDAEGEIRTVLVLRAKGAEGVPEWVGNIVEVREGEVWIGSREEWEQRVASASPLSSGRAPASTSTSAATSMSDAEAKNAAPVVELNGVTVSYAAGARPVLKGIDWTLLPGEKWHLQGANGSGKTTLLSLILGHHPRSFSLPASSLKLFNKPRREVPLTSLRRIIGHTSPEIFTAFPRGMGLSAAQAVGSGFEGVFSRRGLDTAQKERVLCLLGFVRDHLATARSSAGSAAFSDSTSTSTSNAAGSNDAEAQLKAIANRPFAHFTPPQQALLLFLRALVGKPGLVILDEPSQGVDEAMWTRCVELLRQEWAERPEMCTVVVSHYKDEVPWSKGEGRVMRLVDGKGSIE